MPCPYCGVDLIQHGVYAWLDTQTYWVSETRDGVLTMNHESEHDNYLDDDRLWFCRSCNMELPTATVNELEALEPF